MNATVVNLSNLAVTEYTTPFTGLAGDFECTADGVHLVGGSTDNGTKLSPRIELNMSTGKNTNRQRPKYIYVHGTATKGLTGRVTSGSGKTYDYKPATIHGRTTRFTLGAGLRDVYLKFALFAPSADAFHIDQLNIETFTSDTRRL